MEFPSEEKFKPDFESEKLRQIKNLRRMYATRQKKYEESRKRLEGYAVRKKFAQEMKIIKDLAEHIKKLQFDIKWYLELEDLIADHGIGLMLK